MSPTGRAGLLAGMAWLAEFAVQPVRMLLGKGQDQKKFAIYRILPYHISTPRAFYAWRVVCVRGRTIGQDHGSFLFLFCFSLSTIDELLTLRLICYTIQS